jgi:hypothetical protein
MLKSIAQFFQASTQGSQTKHRSEQEQDFCVEPLEDRRLLAGNVSAVMKGGDLIIKGDSLSNNIDVVATGAGVRVVGGLDLNGAQTTVNGLAFVDFSGPNLVTDDVKITLGKGQDRVGMFVAVNDSVSINTGAGSDQVEIISAIGGKLNVNVGSADNLFSDNVFITNSGIQGTARIKGGGGSQGVTIQGSAFFGAKTTISLGGGNDGLAIDGGSSFAKIRANGGGGSGDQFASPFPAVAPEIKGFEIIV